MSQTSDSSKRKSVGIYLAIAGVAVASVGMAVVVYKMYSNKNKKPRLGRHRSYRPKVIVHAPVTNIRDSMTEVFDAEQVQKLWKGFSARSRGKEGISRDEFAKILAKLGIEDEQIVESTFQSFDSDHNGRIEFLELFNMLSIISSGSRTEKLEVMFHMIDTHHTGYITFDELAAMYETTYKALKQKPDPEVLREEVGKIFSLAKGGHPGDRITESEFLELANFEVMNLEEHGGLAEKLLNEFVIDEDREDDEE